MPYVSVNISAMRVKGTPEDKEKLPQIIREHKEWLEDHTRGRQACLKEMDLEGADLSGVDLSYADLSGAYLAKAKLAEAKLTGARLVGASLPDSDLTRANLDGAQMSGVQIMHACLEEASMQSALIRGSVLWDSNFKGANLQGAILTASELCDCTFEGANLVSADLYCTNLDNTVFKGANLEDARLVYATYEYYADFTNANLTGVDFSECDLDEEKLKGAVGFHPHMRCPEEGSFIAWKQCREGRIVKLLIPRHAKRTGAAAYCCRASEALVLDIRNPENEPCEEAVSLINKDFIYRKGGMAYPKEAFDEHLLTDGSGIHFFLTRREAELMEFETDDEEADDDASEEGNGEEE